MLRKILSFTLIACFFLTTLTPLPQAHANTVLGLPAPGTMVNLSPAYEPALIKGLTVHKDNPFLFDFILDSGNSGIAGDDLKNEGDRLVKYFFACLTIPEKDLWVNLSPYEKDRMVPQALGQTALGRDLLAQDYILKQLTASLIYPEKDLGKAFWDRVYAKARQEYGTTQIPVNTFNKVWIVADKANVYEHGQTAFVVNGHLKVMLEEDYMALQKHVSLRGAVGDEAISKRTTNDTHALASQIVRSIILPEIEKEVNTGKNFSTLRQIFNSLILATWYKKNLKEALLNQVYANKSTVKGVNLADPSVKERIYQQYLKAYKKGVFNYIKEDAQPDGQTIPRKYFSGGFESSLAMTVTDAPADAAEVAGSMRDMSDITVGLNINNPISSVSQAMSTPTPDKNSMMKFRVGMRTRLESILSAEGLHLTGKMIVPLHEDGAYDDLAIHKDFMQKVLTLPLDEQRPLLRNYEIFYNRLSRENLETYYSAETLKALDQVVPQSGYYRGDHWTSFPAEELIALGYLKVFDPDALKEETENLKSEVPALTAELSHKALFGYLQASADRLLDGLNLSKDVRRQNQEDLITYLYHQLLTRPNTDPRYVQLCEHTSRDGQQSNIGTNLTGEQQREILDNVLEYGNIYRVQDWGGAVVQSAVLETKRKGQPPEDPFYNLREQTALLRSKLAKAFGDEIEKLNAADRESVFDRYEVKVDRKILSSDELENILERNGISGETRDKVRKIYRIKQEMLLRGEYIVGLYAYPDNVLQKFVETAYKNGLDVFRVFDAFNDVRKISKAVKFVHMVKDVGGAVQPVIHYTTDFPTGVEGYVKLAKFLVWMSGDALDSLVIKDAGGLLEPDKAYELVRALRSNGINVPLQIHIHDVSGNRQLTIAEAIRANGSQYPIIVDVATGELAGPFAQPNIRHFLKMVGDTPWAGDLVKDMDFKKMDEVEAYIRKQILPVFPIASITTQQRWDVLYARIPGGMKTNFDNDLSNALRGDVQKDLRGYAHIINDVFGINILNRNNSFTEEGIKFQAAFIRLLNEEIRKVTEDIGGPSLVTPSSEWIGKQAFNNVMGWALKKGMLDLDRKDRNVWVLDLSSSLKQLSRKEQYLNGILGKKNMHEDLKNFLMERAQPVNMAVEGFDLFPLDEISLINLYPQVNTELVAWAFESEGIKGVELDGRGVMVNEGLKEFQKLKVALGKESVDLPTVKMMREIRLEAQRGDAQAQESLGTEEFHRSLILKLLEKKPELNIAQTWEEYQRQDHKMRARYPEINDSDEDLLLLALFPRTNQFLYLLNERRRYREMLTDSRDPNERALYAKTLRQMGALDVPDPAMLSDTAKAFIRNFQGVTDRKNLISTAFSWAGDDMLKLRDLLDILNKTDHEDFPAKQYELARQGAVIIFGSRERIGSVRDNQEVWNTLVQHALDPDRNGVEDNEEVRLDSLTILAALNLNEAKQYLIDAISSKEPSARVNNGIIGYIANRPQIFGKDLKILRALKAAHENFSDDKLVKTNAQGALKLLAPEALESIDLNLVQVLNAFRIGDTAARKKVAQLLRYRMDLMEINDVWEMVRAHSFKESSGGVEESPGVRSSCLKTLYLADPQKAKKDLLKSIKMEFEPYTRVRKDVVMYMGNPEVDDSLPYKGDKEVINALKDLEHENDPRDSLQEVKKEAIKTLKQLDHAQASDLGGIDLNSANMGMTVSKDANGGVQVNFDPAMIARIKAQGVYSADPFIIRITPMNSSEISPLLGL